MLTAEEVKSRGLIRTGIESSFREISYDLRVGTIIKSDGGVTDFYTVPPQGIVEVVSEEHVCLPDDITGIAMVKTSLSNQGLLALNIAIIDPGYEGKIGSFFVNFGKREQLLKKGDVFLRVVFHTSKGTQTANTRKPVDDKKYIDDKRANMQLNFGNEFLDVGRLIGEYSKKQFEEFRTKVLGYVALAGFILGLMTFALNFGNLLLVQRFLQPNDQTRAELLREALERNSRELLEQNRDLSTRVQQLDQRLRSGIDQLDRTDAQIQKLQSQISASPALPEQSSPVRH